MSNLADYVPIVGQEVIDQLYRLAERLQSRRFVHINSTPPPVRVEWRRSFPGPYRC